MVAQNDRELEVGWSAQQLRTTIFHAAGDVGNSVREFWRNAFGVDPQQDETKNLEGVRVIGGQAGIRLWTMNIRPNRTDLISQLPRPLPLRESASGKKIEDSNQRDLRQILELTEVIADMVSGINRLAFGALLLAPGPDIANAQKILSRALPRLNWNNLNSEDFVYQVNRRRNTQDFPVLEINRLATWSIAQGQAITVQAASNVVSATANADIEYAASLQLDVNTVQIDESNAISAERAKLVFNDLAEMAFEIAKRGDVL